MICVQGMTLDYLLLYVQIVSIQIIAGLHDELLIGRHNHISRWIPIVRLVDHIVANAKATRSVLLLLHLVGIAPSVVAHVACLLAVLNPVATAAVFHLPIFHFNFTLIYSKKQKSVKLHK